MNLSGEEFTRPDPVELGVMSILDLFNTACQRTIFQARWGYTRGALSEQEYGRIISEKVLPTFERMKAAVIEQQIIVPSAVARVYDCRAEGEKLEIFDKSGAKAAEFVFPRSERESGRCVTDFFRDQPRIALWAGTAGQKAVNTAREWYEAGRYSDYHHLHGLVAELTDCIAELIHQRVSIAEGHSLNPAKPAGLRFSFGYPACPELEYQRQLLALAGAHEIGTTLNETLQMEPEYSVSGFVTFDVHAVYFNP